jgi:hypothetical protein
LLRSGADTEPGLAKMNPGLDVHGPDKLTPPLTRCADLSLTDYIVKERLYNFFLPNGGQCRRRPAHPLAPRPGCPAPPDACRGR